MAMLFLKDARLIFLLKSVGNCSFSTEIIVNCQSQPIFVISISILPPTLNFRKMGEVLIFHQKVTENKDDVINTSW